MTRPQFQAAVAALPFGKTLPAARYLYAPDSSALPEPLASFLHALRQRLALGPDFAILKLAPRDFAIAFLSGASRRRRSTRG